ncbi:MAG: PIN domain-containing protein [Pyrinomonadaceae bacterium]
MNTVAANEVVVVDTNVISFFIKSDTRAALYQPHLDGRLQIIAAQTRAELEFWTLIYRWGQRRRAGLHAYLKNFAFAEVDEAICLRWAEIRATAREIGRPINVDDAWIAATALNYKAPLVTHNPSDFYNVAGLTVITEK